MSPCHLPRMLTVAAARGAAGSSWLALQRDVLLGAGCAWLFQETASGAQWDRQHLAAAIDFMREGHTLAVWRLDRQARLISQLIEIVEDRGVGLRSQSNEIETTPRAAGSTSPPIP